MSLRENENEYHGKDTAVFIKHSEELICKSLTYSKLSLSVMLDKTSLQLSSEYYKFYPKGKPWETS
jgi:hypothetical protein